MKVAAIICTLVCLLLVNCNGYKILGVFNSMARSHHIVGSALMKGLAERGHEVTVISPFPQKKPLKNFRDITNVGVLQVHKVKQDEPNSIMKMREQSVFSMFLTIFDMGIRLTNSTLTEKNVQDLLNSGEKFDLVIAEIFLNEALLGLAHHFNAPVIGVSTFGASIFTTELVGSPSPLSYVPNVFLSFTDRMNLLQRTGNVLVNTVFQIFYDYFYLPRQVDLYNKHFRDPKPTLHEVRKNVSLVLLNTHFTLTPPRPYVPNMIEVGGMQVNRKTKPLPKDIQEFLDSAKDGAIYFSMGSNLKSTMLPEDKRNMILKVLGSLKQKVLWKWEDKTLPGKSDNILINDWFPQDDVLAHPNVKLFITHGGLLSTTESIYHGVPVLGIPMFADQFLNMARAESAGYGLSLNFDELDETKFKEAIDEMLNNEKYTKTMKVLSERFRDQPLTPLETAIYWVEYVIKHQGAPHMHSAGQELNFIQYHCLDAFAIIIGGLTTIVYIFVFLIKKLISVIFRRTTKNQKQKLN